LGVIARVTVIPSINAYDEYGIPASTNMGRFQYTGQTWLPEVGLYYYKARMYSPTLGRFMQTDPIGYGDGINWYDYVDGDPVNRSDPTGLKCKQCVTTEVITNQIWGRSLARHPVATTTKGDRTEQGGKVIGAVSEVRKVGNPAVAALGDVPLAQSAKIAVKGVPLAGQVLSAGLSYTGQVQNGKGHASAAINTTGQVASTGLAGAATGALVASATLNPFIIGGASAAGALGFEFTGQAQKVGDSLENFAYSAAIAISGNPPY
jgi:RHS repeat-associated protein